MSGEKILVVDDEERIVKIITAYLEREGFKPLVAYDGPSALAIARKERPNLIILDIMLPELSGLDVCRTLRQDSNIPVIMVTARDDDTDKIVGLELGADDYMTKPFNPKELVARVRAVLRRVNEPCTEPTHRIVVADFIIDVDKHEVTQNGTVLPLTPTEFSLLSTMAAHPGRVYTRLQLLEKAQGEAFEGYERAIDSHIKNLRQKIELDPRQPHYIQTVFGLGYRFNSDAPKEKSSDA
jgi:DNA-binding response OmpR family regulator